MIAWWVAVSLLPWTGRIVFARGRGVEEIGWFRSRSIPSQRQGWTSCVNGCRGGSTRRAVDASESTSGSYGLLVAALRDRLVLNEEDEEKADVKDIIKAFKSLASAQKAFKGLDGAAHEAYRRTHDADDVDISVSGRASRSAARAGATADGLGACELCELVESPDRFDLPSPNGTLAAGREVLLNSTNCVTVDGTNFSVLVLYEASYVGGAGIGHGGIILSPAGSGSTTAKGRLVIAIADGASGRLDRTLKVLEKPPQRVRLNQGLVANEVASVQRSLYKCAGRVLDIVESNLREHNSSAIHFVGRSLAGGVASLAAMILEGSLPIPARKGKAERQKRKQLSSNTTASAPDSNTTLPPSLEGFGVGRSSAVTLGAPPCVSANVQSGFVTSILYGDDVVCRASRDSIDGFVDRARRALKKGFVARQFNWMTDTLSLAASNIKSHAHGSQGEEARLAVPGRAYLVRPRRLGGICSMHEVGGQLKGGREALRAALLWQLNDILLSKSLWKHHQLESYIHGLDRVHLRGLDDEDDEEEEQVGDDYS